MLLLFGLPDLICRDLIDSNYFENKTINICKQNG